MTRLVQTGKTETMTEHVVAVKFDAETELAREFARKIEELTKQLIHGEATIYTEGFRPDDWPPSHVVITVKG